VTPIHSVPCPYCGAREGAPCRTYRGRHAPPHALRFRALEDALDRGRRPVRSNGDPLKAATIELLRLAADAWSADATGAAERLLAAAWAMYDGVDFVDEESVDA
jgi:hypothetical protein